MTRPLRNLISAVTLAALTGLLVLAATQWTDVFFRFYPAFSRWILGVLAGVTSVTSFPLWEPGLCLIVLWGVISLIRSLVRHHFLRWLSGLLLTLCGAAFFFMAVWGLNYFAPPMSDRLGLETQERTPAELREVTAYFLQKANETAPLVERDADGVIEAADLSQLGRQAGAGYETLAKTTDCFDGSTARVKTLLSSKWFGKTGTTGIFIAFTGESSISSTTFTASVPFTMCHEIGHRMAFARENEANFAAFLACEASEDARFAYSGYYTAFLYCYNALRKVDAAAANEVWSGACDELRADCAAANSHYKKVEDQKVSQVTDKIYNSYLQTVGVESGRQSYGEVVDLLTAWYFTQEATQ